MTRFVIDPGVALHFARSRVKIPAAVALVAPSLLRSHVLTQLYAAVRSGTLERREAEGQLDYLRGLKIRLLGDRVLQRQAWNVAERLGWAETFRAEYVAVTLLQADALVTLDAGLAAVVGDIVTVVGPDAVLRASAFGPDDFSTTVANH